MWVCVGACCSFEDTIHPLPPSLHRDSWVQHYPVRNLIAMSAAPLLVSPTHYVGDMGHFSDTEPSMEWVQWKREEYALREKQEKTRKAVQPDSREEL